MKTHIPKALFLVSAISCFLFTEIQAQCPGTDKFGVKEIYPTIAGGEEWFVNMTDPKSDTRFKNLSNITFTKLSDGSWQVYSDQIRMEAWSPTNKKWLNVEIQAYVKFISLDAGASDLLQFYSRGGHHPGGTSCEGSAMKGRFYGNRDCAVVKEINHPAYCGNRGTVQIPSGYSNKKWNGYKTIIYNIVENGKTYVKVEQWIDLNCEDTQGNLLVKGNWIKVTEYVDRGDWSTSNPDYMTNCPALEIGNTGYRKKNEILSLPGGTSTANLVAWRTDGVKWKWKYLSAREIDPRGRVSVTTSTTPDNGSGNGTATATASSGATPYTYSWSTTPVQTTAQATNLKSGTYTVIVTDANGCKDTAIAILSVLTGIIKNIPETEIEVYPNPVQSIVSVVITALQPAVYTLSIRNLLGQELYRNELFISTTGRTEIPIDIHFIKQGTYLLGIYSDNQPHNIKIIKN